MGTRESLIPVGDDIKVADMPIMYCWMNPKLLGSTREETTALMNGEDDARIKALQGIAGLMFNRFVNMDVTNCLGHPARAS